MEKVLTVIIPFVNEGEEVERTVESVLSHSNNNVDILVINDASDDCYDYERNLQKYPVRYVSNSERLGVAASRDKGVSLCKTDYFLLLDAHMRFYDSKWVDVLVQELSRNPQTLLCAQTRALHKVDGEVIEGKKMSSYWGAYINFYTPIEFLEPQWSYTNCLNISVENDAMKKIPCVLGAGYATSKRYWEYLNGLHGLLSYGNDEVLLSMKIWLSGGICKLLPNVTIGHIYRQYSPFKHYTERRIYNRLYISYLLCPSIYQKKLYAIERIKYPQMCIKAWKLFYRNFDTIERDKCAFDQIRIKPFSTFERFNRSRICKEKESIDRKEKFLQKSLLYILSQINITSNIGLINGKLGVVILLYHYARYKKNHYITNLANTFLEEIIKRTNCDSPLNIPDGLLGIGWGISYLFQQKFISGNVNEILIDIDQKVAELTPARMKDLNLEYGLGGILRYVLCRLYDMGKSSECPFPQDFLHELYLRAKEIMEEELINSSPETYMEYIFFYEKKMKIEPASIYDILMLPGWNKYSKASKDISLKGISGMCLEYILTQ